MPETNPSNRPGQPKAQLNPAPASPRRVILWMVLTITLIILATEFSEIFVQSPEPVEGVIHILTLSGVMVPLFYFFWFRPLTQQISLARNFENQVRNLHHRLIGASEKERVKLAQDLHDEFGQKLTSLQLQLASLDQILSQGLQPSADCCKPLMKTVNDLTKDLRNVLADLRPATLDWLGLALALENLCREINDQASSPHIEFRCAGLKGPLNSEIEIALYRATQEALTNILRHARAKHVEICLTRCHPTIILTIQDDGVGIGTEQLSQFNSGMSCQFGLVGMRERVAAIGGDLRITSLQDGGTRIRIEAPELLLQAESDPRE